MLIVEHTGLCPYPVVIDDFINNKILIAGYWNKVDKKYYKNLSDNHIIDYYYDRETPLIGFTYTYCCLGPYVKHKKCYRIIFRKYSLNYLFILKPV